MTTYSQLALAEITTLMDSLVLTELKALQAAVADKITTSQRDSRAEAIAEIHRIADGLGMTPEKIMATRAPYTKRVKVTPA